MSIKLFTSNSFYAAHWRVINESLSSNCKKRYILGKILLTKDTSYNEPFLIRRDKSLLLEVYILKMSKNTFCLYSTHDYYFLRALRLLMFAT